VKDKPVEGKCYRCSQPRALFRYKPLHNCIDGYGSVSLIEAAGVIGWMDDNGDRWCMNRLGMASKRMLCTSCYQVETRDERELIDTVLEKE